MKEAYFTLAKDCTYKDQQFNKGDIVLIIPVPADYHEVQEWFEEEDIDYSGIISIYIYSRDVFIKAAQEGDWIFSHTPECCDYIDSYMLPDLFLELPIISEEVDLGDIEATE